MKDNFKKRRYSMINDKLRKSLEKVLEQLNEGNKEEANELLEKEITRIKHSMNIKTDELKYTGSIESVCIRSMFPASGELFALTDRIKLFAIYDKDKYLSTAREYSASKRLYYNEEFREQMWNDVCGKNCFACGIYLHDGQYIGYCFVDNLYNEDYEIAIELEPEYCNKGYGTDAIRLFMENVASVTGKKKFYTKVELDNYASQRMMKKSGGYPKGICESGLCGEEIEVFREENKHLVTDKMREVAKEFSMEVEDMLGYVLVYEFDLT